MSVLGKKYYNIDNPVVANQSVASSGMAIITKATAFAAHDEIETLAFPTVNAFTASESEALSFA
jgi:hypothetical protein